MSENSGISPTEPGQPVPRGRGGRGGRGWGRGGSDGFQPHHHSHHHHHHHHRHHHHHHQAPPHHHMHHMQMQQAFASAIGGPVPMAMAPPPPQGWPQQGEGAAPAHHHHHHHHHHRHHHQQFRPPQQPHQQQHHHHHQQNMYHAHQQHHQQQQQWLHQQQQQQMQAVGGVAPAVMVAGRPHFPPHHHHQHQHHQQQHFPHHHQQQRQPFPALVSSTQGAGPHHHHGGGGAEPFQQQQQQQAEEEPPREDVFAAAVQPMQPDAKLVAELRARIATQEGDEATATATAAAEAPSLDIDACLKSIAENDVSFIVSDTGSGKSSTLLNELLNRDPCARILSSQPRRVAAMSLAQRVASLRGELVGQSVGFWVRGDHVGDLMTSRLLYMTSYLVFLLILKNPADFPFTHVIIDEFHERQPEVEVLLAMLRLAVKEKMINVKIVLMSATVEVESWQSFFEPLSVGVCSSASQRHEVYEYYGEEVAALTGLTHNTRVVDKPADDVAVQDIFLTTQHLLRLLAVHATSHQSILVFLQGEAPITRFREWINTHLGNELHPIEWTAKRDVNDVQKFVKEPAPDGKKKVYLATDVAEVSITVPDLVFVIDAGLSKKPLIDEANQNTVAFPALTTFFTSSSSLRQRRGRVGRVQKGFYFSLIGRDRLPLLGGFESRISACVLDSLALHVMTVCGNPLIVFDQCAEAPKPSSMRLGILKLLHGGYIIQKSHSRAAAEHVALGASEKWRKSLTDAWTNKDRVMRSSSDEFVLTAKGAINQFLPLSTASAEIVLWGLTMGIAEVATLAACVCDAGVPYYEEVPGTTSAVVQEMRKNSNGIPSDIVASVQTVLEYKQKVANHSEDAVAEWCRAHHVKASRLDVVLEYERSVIESLAGILPRLFSTHKETDPAYVAKQAQQLKDHGMLLTVAAAAGYALNAILVKNDPDKTAVRTAGPSLFLNIQAARNAKSPSVCPWEKGNVVVPISMYIMFRKLIASTALQLSAPTFALMMLVFSNEILYAPGGVTNPNAVYVCYSRHYSKQRLYVKRDLFAVILQARHVISANLAILEKVRSYTEIADALKKSNSAGPTSSTAADAKEKKQPSEGLTEELLQAHYADVIGKISGIEHHKHLPACLQQIVTHLLTQATSGARDVVRFVKEQDFPPPTHRSRHIMAPSDDSHNNNSSTTEFAYDGSDDIALPDFVGAEKDMGTVFE